MFVVWNFGVWDVDFVGLGLGFGVKVCVWNLVFWEFRFGILSWNMEFGVLNFGV